MALIHDLAEELARDAMALSKKIGDEDFPEDLGKSIGRTSTTLEEAYLTALRLLRAADRAREIIAARTPDEKPVRRTRTIPKSNAAD